MDWQFQPTTMKREKEKRERRTASIARRGVGSFLDQMTSDVWDEASNFSPRKSPK